jgi:hypothetical protein
VQHIAQCSQMLVCGEQAWCYSNTALLQSLEDTEVGRGGTLLVNARGQEESGLPELLRWSCWKLQEKASEEGGLAKAHLSSQHMLTIK